MTTIDPQVLAHTTAAELAANRPRLLIDPNALHWVEGESVDVFAVRVENGEPIGNRRHVFRAAEGDLILGLSHLNEENITGIMAVGPLGSALHEASIAQIEQTGSDLEEPFIEGIERWFQRLQTPLLSELLPADSAPLDADTTTQCATGEIRFNRYHELLWIHVTEGSAAFWGIEDAQLDVSSGWVPLGEHGWIQALEQCKIDVIRHPALMAQADAWQIVQAASARLMEVLEALEVRRESSEVKRLDRRQQSENETVSRGLIALTQIIGKSQAGLAGAGESDPLIGSLKVLGEALFIDIRLPARLERLDDHVTRLEAIGRASGFRHRRVELTGAWPNQDAGPLLAFFGDEQQPVALVPSARGLDQWIIHDGSQPGGRRLTKADAKTFSNVAFQLYRPFGARKLKMFEVLSFAMAGRVKDIATIGLLALLVGLLGLVTPAATGYLVDNVIPSADTSQLLQLTFGMISVALATAMFNLTQSFSQLRLEGKADAVLQSAVWDRLLKLPTNFFRDYTAGDLAVRANGISEIRQALSGTTLSSILSSIFSLLSLILMFIYSMTLALVAIGLVVVAILISAGLTLLALRHQRKLAAVEGKISGIVLELLSGVGKLHAAGAQKRAFSRWSSIYGRQQTHTYQAQRIGNFVELIGEVYPLLSTIVLFSMIAFFMAPSSISTGQFLAFNAAFGTFMGGMLGLTNTLIGILGIIPLYERAKPILQSIPEVDPGKADPGELMGNIEVADVFFRYSEDSPLILNDVSFRVNPGEFVAIVGPSGSGKSTLLRLLLGFEEPLSGSIYFDGQDLAGVDITAVRRQLGVVLQNQRLMAGDIFTNIIGSSQLTMQDAEEAARLCGLDEDIAGMPMGMHTVVSDGGGTLSGGQRQRLLIAKAIVNKPRILFFDEATSALDNHTQAVVSASLERMQATRIVIAHRLSTIVNADRILVLEGGRLVEQGNHAELMARGGLFSQMARRQVA